MQIRIEVRLVRSTPAGRAEKVEDRIELIKRRELFIDVYVRYPEFDQMGAGFGEQLAKELESLVMTTRLAKRSSH